MKKLLSIMVAASMLVCSSAPAMAADPELAAAIEEGISSSNVILGSFSSESSDAVEGEFSFEKDADGNKGNFYLSFTSGETSLEVEDAFRYVDGVAYINLAGIIGAAGEESEDLSSMLESLGITGEWISVDVNEFRTEFTDAIFALAAAINEDLRTVAWETLEQEDNALYMSWGNGEDEALQQKIAAVVEANKEKYAGMLDEAISKFDADALLSNKYLTAVVDTLSTLSEDMNKDSLKAMLEGIVAQYSSQAKEAVESSEDLTGTITETTNNYASAGQMILELEEDGMVILDASGTSANEEGEESGVEMTVNFTQGEVDAIEAPEGATDLADILPGIVMVVGSMMSLGQSEEEPAA